jgi:hypothetical protein
MEISEILKELKTLTLDYFADKRSAPATILELHRRIPESLVYDMDEKEPQREFINQVFVSLDNLLNDEFPPSRAELQYFADCFAGTRQFSLGEVREFKIESKKEENPQTQQRPSKPKYNNQKNPKKPFPINRQ